MHEKYSYIHTYIPDIYLVCEPIYLFICFVRVIKFVEYKIWKYSNVTAYEAKVRNSNITQFYLYICAYVYVY